MGKKAKADEITFNYPIPRWLHRKVKLMQLNTGMKVKDIVINALIMYISEWEKNDKGEEEEL